MMGTYLSIKSQAPVNKTKNIYNHYLDYIHKTMIYMSMIKPHGFIYLSQQAKNSRTYMTLRKYMRICTHLRTAGKMINMAIFASSLFLNKPP